MFVCEYVCVCSIDARVCCVCVLCLRVFIVSACSDVYVYHVACVYDIPLSVSGV